MRALTLDRALDELMGLAELTIEVEIEDIVELRLEPFSEAAVTIEHTPRPRKHPRPHTVGRPTRDHHPRRVIEARSIWFTETTVQHPMPWLRGQRW